MRYEKTGLMGFAEMTQSVDVGLTISLDVNHFYLCYVFQDTRLRKTVLNAQLDPVVFLKIMVMVKTDIVTFHQLNK
jgi:hypothetical protein